MPAKKPQKPITNLKRIGKGPFRGPTPEGIIQTLDVGTGTREAKYGLERFKTNADNHPNRYYKGVDFDLNVPIKGINYDVEWNDAILTVENLIKKGIKIRHVNFTYPIPFFNDFHDAYGFVKLLQLLKKILLPNGKIFIISEEPKFLEALAIHAKENDFASTPVRARYSTLDYKRILTQMRLAKQKGARGTTNGLPMSFDQEYFIKRGKKPYFLELTYALKSAIPNIEQRRNWPRV